jgi:hypothetical protein
MMSRSALSDLTVHGIIRSGFPMSTFVTMSQFSSHATWYETIQLLLNSAEEGGLRAGRRSACRCGSRNTGPEIAHRLRRFLRVSIYASSNVAHSCGQHYRYSADLTFVELGHQPNTLKSQVRVMASGMRNLVRRATEKEVSHGKTNLRWKSFIPDYRRPTEALICASRTCRVAANHERSHSLADDSRLRSDGG